MRRWLPWLPAIISVALSPVIALALTQASIPVKFAIPWGNAAGGAYIRVIPQGSQIGIQNCAASLTDGFPPLTFVPQSAGGCPPFGQDMNGILKQITQWAQWQATGASPVYDSSFSSSIGGYPSGARLANAGTPGCFWISTIDNNSSNPDTGGANWQFDCPGGGVASVSSGGSANAQTASGTPAVLQKGMIVQFVAGATNTGAMTFNYNSLGAKNVYRLSQLGATQSVGGEVYSGQVVVLIYDGTEWVCQSCGVVMVGELRDFSGSTAPAGWAFADGSCNSQTTYADLFAVTSTNYGSCSAGNFAFPDTRGRTTAGLDNYGTGAASRLTSASTGCGTAFTAVGVTCANASQSHTQIIAELAAHTHPTGAQVTQAGAGAAINQAAGSTGNTSGSTGSSQAMPIVNPVLAVNKIVKL